jgi:hypothetical protein
MNHLKPLRIGSVYGGWHILDLPSLKTGWCMSAGLGEDASFDVELCAKFGASVCVIDPTPRAILHYYSILKNIGNNRAKPYAANGSQHPENYDLSGIDRSHLNLVPCAISHEVGLANFYAPADPEHVSYSLVDLQKTEFERPVQNVVTLTYDTVRESVLAGVDVPLLKLDIEGSEPHVIYSMLESKYKKPEQLLVEYDCARSTEQRVRSKALDTHKLLLSSGYTVFATEGFNISYFYNS